jgi:hypothetical protein
MCQQPAWRRLPATCFVCVGLASVSGRQALLLGNIAEWLVSSAMHAPCLCMSPVFVMGLLRAVLLQGPVLLLLVWVPPCPVRSCYGTLLCRHKCTADVSCLSLPLTAPQLIDALAGVHLVCLQSRAVGPRHSSCMSCKSACSALASAPLLTIMQQRACLACALWWPWRVVCRCVLHCAHSLKAPPWVCA